MRFVTLFSGALVATTAVNILLASDAHAGWLPNGWEQMGKSCEWQGNTYHKLRRKNRKGVWGVYRNKKTWQQKGINQKQVNEKMNGLCNCGSSSVNAWFQNCSYSGDY
tara:strand:- start:31 stop:354 length:324 start_codon:yes stop_codon:yes gene_type:complete